MALHKVVKKHFVGYYHLLASYEKVFNTANKFTKMQIRHKSIVWIC